MHDSMFTIFIIGPLGCSGVYDHSAIAAIAPTNSTMLLVIAFPQIPHSSFRIPVRTVTGKISKS